MTHRRRIMGGAGFTLPEALVMIIITGLMVGPLAGVLLQSTEQTSKLREQIIARQMALSAQARILAMGPYDPVNDYSIPDVSNPIGATMSGRITWSEIPEMGFLPTGANSISYVKKPFAMWAYRIEVDRQAYETEIPAASLTFLTGIVRGKFIGGESVFVSSPSLGKIAAVDQEVLQPAYISLPSRPGHLVVHPAGNLLFAQCATGVSAVCIDPASSAYNQEVQFLPIAGPLFDTSTDNLREDVGIDIRLDGKYLFCWDGTLKKIHVIETSGVSPFMTDSGLDVSANGGVFGGTKGTGLRVSTDNILYISNDSGAGSLFWLDVGYHGSPWDWPSYDGGTTLKALPVGSYNQAKRPLDVRFDGGLVLAGRSDNSFDPIDPLTAVVGTNLSGIGTVEGVTFSRSSRYAVACDLNTTNRIWYMHNCATQPSLVSQTIVGVGKGYFPTVSADNQNVFWTNYSNDGLYYLNLASLTAGVYPVTQVPSKIALETNFNSIGIASRRFPLIYVGTSDGTSNLIEILDGGLMSAYWNQNLNLKPETMAINRLGDQIWSAPLGVATGAEKTDMYTAATGTIHNAFTPEKVIGVAYASDTIYVVGEDSKVYYGYDPGIAAPTGVTVKTLANPLLQDARFVVPFHRCNAVLISYPNDTGFVGGFRIASNTAANTFWDYPASPTTGINWPNHPCGAIALSPNDGLLAVQRYDLNPQEIYVYDLGGDWPPKNPTWGKFSVQKFVNTDASVVGGTVPAYPSPWGTFESTLKNSSLWFPDTTYNLKALRYFTEFHFGAGAPTWRIYAACDDGNRVAVGTSTLSAPDGFINENAFQTALYDNSPNNPVPNEPPWSKHGGHDNQTPAFTTGEWGKIWFEWYDCGGGATAKLGVHRDAPSVQDVLFNGNGVDDNANTANPASFGFNLHSKPVLATHTPIPGVFSTDGLYALKPLFSANGEWLFVLDRKNRKIVANCVASRTALVSSVTWEIPDIATTTDQLVDFCLSADGSTLYVAASTTAGLGKVFQVDVSDDSSTDFLRGADYGETTQTPYSIACPQVSTLNNRHRCRLINTLSTTLWGSHAVTFNKRIYVIGGFATAGNYSALSNVWVFNPIKNSFDTGLTLAAPFGQGGACVVDDMILTTMGVNGGTTTMVNKTQRYWPAGGDANFVDISQNYNQVLNGGARWISMCSLDGFAYAFGGKDSANSAYTGDFGSLGFPRDSTNTALSGWLQVKGAGFPARMGGNAVRCGSQLYFMGGWDGAIKSETYAYDPATNVVTAKAAMSQGRTGFAVCQYQGKIYVFGGTDNANTAGSDALSSVECYDPIANTWTTLPPLPKALYYLTGAQYGGKMYLFGGNDSSGTSVDEIYEYDL